MINFKNYNGENIEAELQATTTSDGLISAADKVKLDGIAAGANKYTHPANHPASIITQDANNRFVTDAEKTAWNAKASNAIVTATANGLMSSADKTKLNGIAAGANNYVHPANHPPSIITQDANNRFVTDAEKTKWNAYVSVATVSTNGLMSSTDKTKLNGIAAGANNYVHPANHPASIITQNANNRFVTDAEKTKWNNGSYEYGSNANGYYKKYGDGTLEMWGIVDISINIANNNAVPYNSNISTINFPVTSVIPCSCTIEVPSAGLVWASAVNSVDFTSSIAYRLFATAIYTPLTARIQWTAKGKWK